MDRLLRLSGAGLGGMGGAQQPADAPVVDTAEQVLWLHDTLWVEAWDENLGLHLLPGLAENVEARAGWSSHGGDGSDAGRVCGRIHRLTKKKEFTHHIMNTFYPDLFPVRVIDVFAMPQSGTGVSVEAVDPVFQVIAFFFHNILRSSRVS